MENLDSPNMQVDEGKKAEEGGNAAHHQAGWHLVSMSFNMNIMGVENTIGKPLSP